MEFQEGDVVMCTVERITRTIVFVKIDGNYDGSIIMSEIAPGRIRNIRDYVVPKKKIICKILRISGDRIDLSLRRVTQKEQKEIREQYKQEKSYKSLLKSILKEKADEIIKEITKQEKLFEFLEKAKQDSKKLEKVVGKKDSAKILEILNSQKQKQATIKKEISLTTANPQGLKLIKELLKTKEAEIKYISAGKYQIKTTSTNLKEADSKLRQIIDSLEKQAKKQGFEFSVKEK